MRTREHGFAIGVLALSLGAACGDGGEVGAGAAQSGIRVGAAATRASRTENAEASSSVSDIAGDPEMILDCPHGGAVSVVHAEFDCTSITTYTCKDLSNVVLEFADGSRQRWEGQSGHVNTFHGTGQNVGKEVVRVWIKAGPNHSGDGPGYGERIEAPAQDCTPPAAGSGGGGTGGSGPCIIAPDGTCRPEQTAGRSAPCIPAPDGTCAPPQPVGGAARGAAGNGDTPL